MNYGSYSYGSLGTILGYPLLFAEAVLYIAGMAAILTVLVAYKLLAAVGAIPVVGGFMLQLVAVTVPPNVPALV
jgi:hypothetical protein